MKRNQFASVRNEKLMQLGGLLSVENINKIKVFLLVGGLSIVTLSLVGCFQPETSLANRNDDIKSTFAGKRPEARVASVDPRTESSLLRYGSMVRNYSTRYDLDWRLVMAVMRHESRFAPNAVSNRGAFGLMQIMPATQVELAGKLGVNETETPSNNIKAGAFHLQQLYRAIDAADEDNHIRLTLAAYNAGLNRILDAQDVATYLGDDPNKWESVKTALPLLSKRYQDLHRNIWQTGKPRAGYFTDWHQTIGYVESVMSYYSNYQVALK
jgi:membrane-bound lytic murein transglycosylase MltF